MNKRKLYPPKCSECNLPIHGEAEVTVSGNGFIMKHQFDCLKVKREYEKATQ